MVLWWIGNVVLLVVVLPVVIFLLNRVLAALERIRGATDDILAGGVALIGELDGVPDGAGRRPTRPSRKSPSARSGTRAPSRSCSAERREGQRHASSRLGDHRHRGADHRCSPRSACSGSSSTCARSARRSSRSPAGCRPSPS